MPTINGTSGNDVLVGTSGDDVIWGFGGADTISAGDGNDTIAVTTAVAAGDTDDQIDGGLGNDTLVATNNDMGILFGSLTGVECISSGGNSNVAIWGTSADETWDFSSVVLSNIVYLDAGIGNDSISGSAGADTFKAYAGNDTLSGNGGNDTFWYTGAGNGVDVINGGSDNDRILALAGNTIIGLHSITGVETVSGNGNSGVSIAGGVGDDSLDFTGVTVTQIVQIGGGDGADTITGSSAADTISGGDGADLLAGGAGNDLIDGGLGADTVAYSGNASAYYVYWGPSFTQVTRLSSGESDRLTNVEHLSFSDGLVSPPTSPPTTTGTAGADTINDTSGSDSLVGLAGNDVISGNDGDDTINGGLGDDSLNGGSGADVFVIESDARADGADWIDGGAGNDTIVIQIAAANLGVRSLTNVEVINGNGFTYGIAGSTSGDFIDLSGTTIIGNLPGIDGGAGNDTIIGTSGADTIIAWDGFDSLSGGGGNDVFRYQGTANNADAVDGGSGNDLIVAIAANTWIGLSSFTGIEAISSGGFSGVAIHGSSGSDYLDFSNVTLTGIDAILGQGGSDTIIGSAGADYITGTLIDGGPGNDVLTGTTVTYANSPNGVTINLWLTGAQAGWGLDTLTGVPNLIGSAFNDYLFGNGGANSLLGGYGDDTIEGSTGNDTLDGGAGIDWVNFETANTGVEVYLATTTPQLTWVGTDVLLNFENVTGSAYRDFLTGDGGANILDGRAHNDDITGGGGDDTLMGGANDDTFFYSGTTNGFDKIDGGSGNDIAKALSNGTVIGLKSVTGLETITANGFTGVTIKGSAGGDALDFTSVTLTSINSIDGDGGNDTIAGSATADVIWGSAGDDSLQGGGGNDIFNYAAGVANGADNVDGGSGNDTLTATANDAAIGLHSFASVEAITGGGFTGVSIVGGSAADSLNFSAVTLSGISLIDGGGGNDTLVGTSGADTLAGSGGDDSLNGASGADVFSYTGSSNGFDAVDGGGGSDTITATAASTVIGLKSLIGVEAISSGGFGSVSILGSTGGDNLDFSAVTLTGLAAIDGAGGADTLIGAIGDDTLIGSAGDDSLAGGGGNDVFAFAAGNNGVDAIDGGSGADTIVATANGVTIGIAGLTSIDVISAGGYAGLHLVGTSGADVLDFSSIVLAGVTDIDGGTGNDAIIGGSDADTLLLGAGQDTFTGAAGSDRFVMSDLTDSTVGSGSDLITDFSSGSDLLDLSGLDANAGVGGDQAFTYVGASAFSNTAGELRLDTTDPSKTLVLGDVDGDGTADFAIVLTGAVLLTGADFVL